MVCLVLEPRAAYGRRKQIHWAMEAPPQDIALSYGPTPASFSFIFGLFKQKLQFLQQKYVKNVHPVYGAGIWTHYLRNVSLFPKPLDQDSRPGYCTLYSNFD